LNPSNYTGGYFVSAPHFGLEVIFANNTSFFDEIDTHHGFLFAAGENNVREISENPFQMTDHHFFPHQRHNFLSFKTYQDAQGNEWAVGPINPDGVFNALGYNNPLYITGAVHTQPTILPGQYLLASVSLDAYNGLAPLAYFAGWSLNNGQANLTLIRTAINVTAIAANSSSIFVFNPSLDSITFPSWGFKDYTRTFKPWIFHSDNRTHLIIVDPASNCIVKINIPSSPTSPLTYGGRIQLRDITGATFDYKKDVVYIGQQGMGIENGTIVAVDIINMRVIQTYHLTEFESNPRGLSVDGNGNLYVGLYGGHAILKVDTSAWKTVGYVTLPHDMRSITSISARSNHVYFVTHEQHSKVGRVTYDNFCAGSCDRNFGFCSGGVCQCLPHLDMAADKRTCLPHSVAMEELEADKAAHNHRGEVALGLLFALSFIAAVAGWVYVFRHRIAKKVNYTGLSTSASDAEENERFI